MVLTVAWLLLNRRLLSPMVSRLIVAGFVAPVPIMWSEIMHWRYYSFVYFFFLYAVVLNMEERVRAAIRIRHATEPGAVPGGPVPATEAS